MFLERFTNLFNLSGQVAIVTGAAQGNGMAISNALYDAGATVIAGDLSFSENCKLHDGIKKVIIDVTDEKNVEDKFLEIYKDFKKIDILVNNAGIIYKELIDNIDISKFKKVMDVNLIGTVICTKHAVEYIKKNNYGRIVNISSSQAYLRTKTYSAYSASKTAVSHLTRIWGNELAEFGIIVNAICPSFVMTPMMENSILQRSKQLNIDINSAIDLFVDDIPLKRILSTDEVSNWVIALCSKLSNSTTGNNFSITAGQVQL